MTVIENNSPKEFFEGPFEVSDLIPFTFPYTNRTDVKVKIGDEAATYGVEYEISAESPSSILVKVNIDSGVQVTVYRETPIDQQSSYPQNSKFRSEQVESDFDKVCMIQQEQQEMLARCLRVPVENIVAFDGELPSPQEGKILVWSDEGKIVNSPSTITEIEDLVDTAVSDAATAVASADSAVSTANSASADAASAVETATYASNKVDEFGEDIEAVIEAAEKIDKLEEAVDEAIEAADTAEQAAAQATEAAEEAMQALSTKQDVLVSGTNIKTVNSASLLGSGNIDVGTVTSVNNVSPDSSGNVSITIPDTSTLANYNLSNLSAAGKDKVVALAHELDWSNAIAVSTTSSTSTQTYTATADGMFFVVSYMEGGSSAKTSSAYIIKNEVLSSNHLYGNTMNGTGAVYLVSTDCYIKSGEQVNYYMYTGGTATYKECQATFVPFKKS